MNGTKTAAHGGRYPSLDGLRGLAALVVFLFHAMLVSPDFCGVVDGAPADASTWWLVQSPLRLFWAGEEAVSLFFVLSGFVLGLPYLRPGASPVWRAYYASRLVRLYLPVAGSLIWAAATFLLIDHQAAPNASRWMVGHDLNMTASIVVHDLLLIDGTGYLNSVLWSLRWEVIFSLILPVALLVTVRAGRLRPALMVATVVLLGVCGVLEISSGAYMLMFCFGLLMAAERERIARVAAQLSGASWITLTVLAATLLLCRWWPGIKVAVAPALVTVGSGMTLALFLLWSPASRVGQAAPVKWLGDRSFSFYLVHDPVVTCSALLLGTHNPALLVLVALPTSLAVTALFFRIVEQPSHRAAKRAGRLVSKALPPREMAAMPATGKPRQA